MTAYAAIQNLTDGNLKKMCEGNGEKEKGKNT